MNTSTRAKAIEDAAKYLIASCAPTDVALAHVALEDALALPSDPPPTTPGEVLAIAQALKEWSEVRCEDDCEAWVTKWGQPAKESSKIFARFSAILLRFTPLGPSAREAAERLYDWCQPAFTHINIKKYKKQWTLNSCLAALRAALDVEAKADRNEGSGWFHLQPLDYCIRKDGDQFCATYGDFINLQESIAGFGETPLDAFDALEESCGPMRAEAKAPPEEPTVHSPSALRDPATWTVATALPGDRFEFCQLPNNSSPDWRERVVAENGDVVSVSGVYCARAKAGTYTDPSRIRNVRLAGSVVDAPAPLEPYAAGVVILSIQDKVRRLEKELAESKKLREDERSARDEWRLMALRARQALLPAQDRVRQLEKELAESKKLREDELNRLQAKNSNRGVSAADEFS